MTHRPPLFSGRRRLEHLGRLLLASLCLAAGGCQSMAADVTAWKWWDRGEEESIDETTGPLERVLRRALRDQEQRNAVTPPEGLAAYDEAQQLYDAGEYGQAEKAFKKVAKQYKDTPIEEDALFMRAECQFEQKQYSWAQDGYDELFKRYPSTRHMDVATRRMFRIAQIWLQFPDVVTTGEVQQVNMEKPNSTPPPPDPRPTSYDPTRVVPIFPNLVDRSRPVFDTEGRALQALKSIWLNDPTGPLADDALMLTASHHLREGNYMEADRIYSILREQYTKSSHLENAFVLGSHVRLMSYQGPSYDGTSLETARQLKESTLRLYPEHADRERLLDEIRQIDEALAAREWEAVVFWQQKNKPTSVAACCREVIRLHPNSTHAAKARALLAELEDQERGSSGMRLFAPRLLPFLESPEASGSDEIKPLPTGDLAEPHTMPVDDEPGRTGL